MNAQRCLRGFRTVPYVEPGSEALRLLVLYVVAATRKLGGAARRMEHANNGTVCTPRRRFEQAQRRATAIAKHVDARAGAARSEEPAPVGDDGATVVAFAARFARRAVADAVAAR